MRFVLSNRHYFVYFSVFLRRSTELLHLDCRKYTKMSELVWGIKNGDIDQVKDIIENKKIDVNALIDGRVPLHYAADYGQTAVLNYLLDKGADPNMLDKHGISVILAAIWEGHTDCVKTLLKNGASKDGKTPDGTPYIEAAEKDEIKELLT